MNSSEIAFETAGKGSSGDLVHPAPRSEAVGPLNRAQDFCDVPKKRPQDCPQDSRASTIDIPVMATVLAPAAPPPRVHDVLRRLIQIAYRAFSTGMSPRTVPKIVHKMT